VSKTRKMHLGFMVFWLLMIIPTITIWKESILLVLLMSLYANIEASATAFISAKENNVNIDRPASRTSSNSSTN
jgi:hypothetical protein